MSVCLGSCVYLFVFSLFTFTLCGIVLTRAPFIFWCVSWWNDSHKLCCDHLWHFSLHVPCFEFLTYAYTGERCKPLILLLLCFLNTVCLIYGLISSLHFHEVTSLHWCVCFVFFFVLSVFVLSICPRFPLSFQTILTFFVIVLSLSNINIISSFYHFKRSIACLQF